MRTAWMAIPTLSRTCVHCCSGLSAAHCSAYAQQELNEWESLTDAPVRPLGSSRTARIMTSAPSLNTSIGSAAHAGAYRGVVEELPAARRVLLAARRRCSAECDAVRRGTGRPRSMGVRVNGGADCRLRSSLYLAPHLAKGVFGNADAARFCNGFERSRYIDAIAENVISFDQNVAEMDAHAPFHSALVGEICVAFREIGR